MKPVVGVCLGLVFVGLAGANVITMLERARPGRTLRAHALATSLHRIGGYLFFALFAVMSWSMSKRLIGYPTPMSSDVVLHVALALLLAPLLIVKVLIARRYKSHHSLLPPLGLAIFAVSFVLVFIRVLPFLLARLDLPNVVVKYSVYPLAFFCVSLAWLALRGPVASSASMGAATSPTPIDSSSSAFALELMTTRQQTHDAKTLCFRPRDGRQVRARPGQFLTFDMNINGRKVVRSYSICSSPLRTDYVEITPKRMANGCASVFLNDHARAGLTLQARGPFGHFYFDEQLHQQIVLIAGGSGITPMLGMLRYIEDRALSTPVTLLYFVRTPRDVIFAPELQRLQRSLAHFRYQVVISAPEDGWTGSVGRISASLLQSHVPDFRKPTFFLCGPKPFMQLAEGLLAEQGVPPSRVKQESFGGNPAASGPDSSAITEQSASRPSCRVEFARSGVSCELRPDRTLLESAEAAGVSIPYSCRQGECGTCVTRLLRGHVTMQNEDGLSAEQKQSGFILPCVSRAEESVTLEA